MTDFKEDNNTAIFQRAIKKLRLRFPVADIVKKTGYTKGAVSNYLNGVNTIS